MTTRQNLSSKVLGQILLEPTGLPTIIIPSEIVQTVTLKSGFVIRWAEGIRTTSGRPLSAKLLRRFEMRRPGISTNEGLSTVYQNGGEKI